MSTCTRPSRSSKPLGQEAAGRRDKDERCAAQTYPSATPTHPHAPDRNEHFAWRAGR